MGNEKRMKHLMIGAAAIALLGACGNNNEQGEADLGKAGEATARSVENALKDLGDITLRRGDADQAETALAAMSLDASGSGRVSFGDSRVEDDGATFSDVSVAIPGEDDGDGADIVIGTLELDGLNYENDAPSFSSLTLSDIEIVPRDEDDREDGSMTVASMSLLNPSPELAAWVASLTGSGEPAPFPTPENVGFDRWDLNGFAFNLDDGDEVVDFTVESIALGGAESASMEVAAINNIEISGTNPDGMPFSAKLDAMNLLGADFAFVRAIQENADDEEAMGEALMAALYDDPMDPGFDRLQLENLTFVAEGIDFAMPRFDTIVERNDAGVAERYLTPEFTMSLSADPAAGEAGSELAGMLGSIGYEALELKGAGASTYDAETDMLEYAAEDNYLTLTDGFTLRYGGKLQGYSDYARSFASMDMDMMAAGPDDAMMQEALSKLVLHDFTLVLDDNSIVDRIFNLVAAQSGEDPAALRQQAIAMTSMGPMMAAGSGVDMELITEATTAVAAFLEEPGTLTFRLDPAEPISAATFAEVEDPSQITKETLGFSVTHEN